MLHAEGCAERARRNLLLQRLELGVDLERHVVLERRVLPPLLPRRAHSAHISVSTAECALKVPSAVGRAAVRSLGGISLLFIYGSRLYPFIIYL